MTGLQMRESLRNGTRVYGTHIASLMNPLAASISAEMEIDFAFVCTEHMPLDRTEVSMMCQHYRARGISPIVRVPSPDAAAVTMAMDGGAEGIVVPYVETAEQVRRMSGAVRYRPIKGELLDNALSESQPLPEKTRAFLKGFNRNHYLIIGVESVPAIRNLEQLLAAGEVDGVFLGPHDISISMGLPEEYHHPEFIDAIEDVIRRCRRHNVGVGLHTLLLRMGEEPLHRFFKAGMNWIINGADISLIRQAMNAQLNELRRIAGDVRSNGDAPSLHRSEINTCIV